MEQQFGVRMCSQCETGTKSSTGKLLKLEWHAPPPATKKIQLPLHSVEKIFLLYYTVTVLIQYSLWLFSLGHAMNVKTMRQLAH